MQTSLGSESIIILWICGGRGLHLSWIASTRTHSCQAFDECLHYKQQMHWLLFCTSQHAHHQLCHNHELPTLVSTTSLGLQLHLPQFTSPCEHIPFCDVVQWQRHQTSKPHLVTPDGTLASTGLTCHMQWFVPKVLPIFFMDPLQDILCPNCPSHYPEHHEGPWRTSNVQVDLSLSPGLFLLIPSPITPLLLLPTRKI